MEPPITNECDALREEVAMLEAENRRLRAELLEARKVPAVPEAAIRAVWEAGCRFESETGVDIAYFTDDPWPQNAEKVGRVFVEAMRDA